MSTTVSPAIEELAGALGADAVLTSDEDLREFRDPFAHASWDDYTAAAVVMPETVEQVQEVVRIAGRHKGVKRQPMGSAYGRQIRAGLAVDVHLPRACFQPREVIHSSFAHLRGEPR